MLPPTPPQSDHDRRGSWTSSVDDFDVFSSGDLFAQAAGDLPHTHTHIHMNKYVNK